MNSVRRGTPSAGSIKASIRASGVTAVWRGVREISVSSQSASRKAARKSRSARAASPAVRSAPSSVSPATRRPSHSAGERNRGRMTVHNARSPKATPRAFWRSSSHAADSWAISSLRRSCQCAIGLLLKAASAACRPSGQRRSARVVHGLPMPSRWSCRPCAARPTRTTWVPTSSRRSRAPDS